MSDQEAFARYKILADHIERGVPISVIARNNNISARILWKWLRKFQADGLPGLSRKSRADKGGRRKITAEVEKLIAGLVLRKPPPSIATVFRTVKSVCEREQWTAPSYSVVYDAARELSADLTMLAHEGDKAYCEAFDIIHRREADRPNEIWQADHTPLDILALDSDGQAHKPILTAILDDYSRAVPGYYLAFEPPSSMRIALALRQAIWRKDDAGWAICGIPEKFYSDRGSDFMSHHIDQVSIDLKFELIQTLPGKPQGKGKIERFFGTVNELLLSTLPGYAPAGSGKIEAVLTIEELDQKFKTWLIDDYHERVHSEIETTPKIRWESFAFLPRLPASIEQLDHLLLTVAKPRRVQRDGISFQGFRYFDINLAGYVGEDVTIRYDPRDLAEIFVYADNSLVCRAVCYELADTTVSLKDIIKARRHRKKMLKADINELLGVAEKHAPVQKQPNPQTISPTPTEYPKFKIKRFACDDD